MSFDAKKFEHYKSVGESAGLSSVWSIYEVENLNDKYGVLDSPNLSLLYKNHSGDGGDVKVPVKGSRFLDLYIAADKAIKKSGDNSHVYIEGFDYDHEASSKDSIVFELITGS